jgi:hypothetical protein
MSRLPSSESWRWQLGAFLQMKKPCTWKKGDYRTKMRLMLRWLNRFVFFFSFDSPSLHLRNKIQKKSQAKQRTISKEQFNL